MDQTVAVYKGVLPIERRILIVGKTGVGKSKTGNTLLGKNIFTAELSDSSVTKTTTQEKADRFYRSLVVADTPGFFDTELKDSEVFREIMKFHGLLAPGPHAVILVVRIGRLTEEDKATLRFFKTCFSEEVIRHTMIVFTGKGDLGSKQIEEYVDNMKNEEYKDLIKEIEKRFVSVGMSEEVTEEREEEVKEILGMIDSMVAANGEQFYSNDAFKQAENLIVKEIEAMENKRKAAALEEYKLLGKFKNRSLDTGSEEIIARNAIRESISLGVFADLYWNEFKSTVTKILSKVKQVFSGRFHPACVETSSATNN